MNKLYRIDTDYACGGVIVNDLGVVIEAANTFKWMIGKNFDKVKRWRNIKELILVSELDWE